MEELKKTLATVAASLHVLGANTVSNTQTAELLSREMEQMAHKMENLSHETSLMAARNRGTEEAVASLQGTFASIEVQMVRQFERHVEHERDIGDLKRRVDALEKKQSPAA